VDKKTISSAKQFSDERLTKVNVIKRKRSSIFLLNFLPGQHMTSHNHPNRELYMHVLEGNGTLLIDEKKVEVQQGDVIYCDPEEQIGFTNSSENKVTIYATLTKLTE